MAERERTKKLGVSHRKMFNKTKALKYWTEMRASGLTLKRWCWLNRVLMGVLIKSLIKSYPEIWEADKDLVGEYFYYDCKSCALPFYANTKRGRYCSDHCADMSYLSRIARAKKRGQVASSHGEEDSTG